MTSVTKKQKKIFEPKSLGIIRMFFVLLSLLVYDISRFSIFGENWIICNLFDHKSFDIIGFVV